MMKAALGIIGVFSLSILFVVFAINRDIKNWIDGEYRKNIYYTGDISIEYNGLSRDIERSGKLFFVIDLSVMVTLRNGKRWNELIKYRLFGSNNGKKVYKRHNFIQ